MDLLTLNPTLGSLSFISTNTQTAALYPTRLSFFKLTCINRLRAPTVSLCRQSASNSLNPEPEFNNNHTFPLNALWLLVPIFRKIKGLASSQSRKWVSRFQAYRDDKAAFSERHVGDYSQNGGFGVALLSLTASAKVKISPFVATLAANPTFVSGLFAWLTAQSMKVFLNFFVERKWDFRILCASGGMPSSHSALCMALTTSVAFCHGVADSLFPVCLGFSLIVMYDAIGVRRHAGMQAEPSSRAVHSGGFVDPVSSSNLSGSSFLGSPLPQRNSGWVLNLIIKDLFKGHPVSQRKLKELLGHTPSQVLAGAVLGILVACICCQGCFVAT